MATNPFGFGSTLNPSQQTPWSAVGGFPTGVYPIAPPTAPQILQWLQQLPQQLQQLTYLQQQTLQQLLQVVPAQYQQLQQVTQLLPHVIHQLQHLVLTQQSPAGLPYTGSGIGGFGSIATIQPFQAFPSVAPSVYATPPSHVM